MGGLAVKLTGGADRETGGEIDGKMGGEMDGIDRDMDGEINGEIDGEIGGEIEEIECGPQLGSQACLREIHFGAATVSPPPRARDAF